MVNTLASFPSLPLLTFEQASAVLDDVGMPKRTRAALSGLSRQMLWKCEGGVGNPQTKTLEAISLLAYKVLVYQAGGGKKFHPRMDLAAVKRALAYDPVNLANQGPALYRAKFGQEQ